MARPEPAALARARSERHALAARAGPLLPHPQDRGARAGARRASPPGSPAASASRAGCAARCRRSRASPRAAASSSTRWRPGRPRTSSATGCCATCRRIRWSPTASPRSAACPARGASPPASRRAPAAGGASTRPNAASIGRGSEHGARSACRPTSRPARSGWSAPGRAIRACSRCTPLHALEQADVILHDALIAPEILALVRRRRAPRGGRQAGRPAERAAARDQPAPDRARPRRACAWSASRAAIRSCSAAAARRRWRSPPPACRSASCRASPRASPRPPTPASRRPTARSPRRVAFVTGHNAGGGAPRAVDWAALAKGAQTHRALHGPAAPARDRAGAARARAARRTSRWRS